MKEILSLSLGVAKSYLLRTSKGYILIDTGVPGKEKKFMKFLKKQGINPKEIKLIIVTHVHSDHVGSLKAIQKLTNAKVLVHEKGYEYLTQGKSSLVKPTSTFIEKLLSLLPARNRFFEKIKPDITINDNFSLEEYGLKGKIIHTPGHTKESISVLDDKENAFIGDLAMAFPLKFSAGLPIIAEDLEEVKKSWRLLLNEGVKNFYLSHGGKIKSICFEKILQKNRK
ncbi:MAG: MBL fold metallo-hydrolase [Candidatus Heimdallarchaeaceae archaeon]